MKLLNVKAIVASLAVSAVMLLSTSAQGQSISAVIAGSSALFNTFGYTAFDTTAGQALCGANHWSYKSSGASTGTTFVGIHDARSSSIPDEGGTIWVSWNGSADGTTTVPTKVCAYINVDSTIGVRSAFARDASGNPAATLLLTVASGTAGANKVLGTTENDVALPASILAVVNGAHINVAAADIRPEDAYFATQRTLTAAGTKVSNSLLYATGLGYATSANANIGYPIVSSRSTATANPVNFALYGTDPISSGSAAASYNVLPVGAGPVMVFVNTSNSASYHLGDTTLTNITSNVLAGVLDGTFSRTRDLWSNTTGEAAYPLTVFLREPLSGTMNTIEYNVPASFRYFSTQEKGITGGQSGATGVNNPLNLTSTTGSGGIRARAIGTGEEVAAVIATADSLGYAFWGYGNFANATSGSVARYLTVDGVDPLYASNSTSGVFPVKTSGAYPVLSFPNIINGSYPIWTIFRLVYTPSSLSDATSKSTATSLIAAAQTNASVQSDFVPYTNLNVFRSHFYQANMGGDNGHETYVDGSGTSYPGYYFPEAGGDVGGQVYPIQADYDFITDSPTLVGHLYQLINRHN